MRKLTLFASVLLAGCATEAQIPSDSTYSYSYASNVVQQPVFAPEQLDILLGSIALYPDPLVALILPASTNASDIVLAARYLQAGGDPAQAESQPWDDSVQALAHYPEIIRWMDQNLAWTKQLGQAVAMQSPDVMAAIQRLRARARDAGTLVSTPQQQVVVDADGIRILPANPEVVYIPYYDPTVVYARTYYSYPPETYFNYSVGFASGWWLSSYSLDWGSRSVWTIDHADRQRYWREHERDWHRQPPRHRAIPGYSGSAHVWQPRPGHLDTRPPRIDTRPPRIDTRPAAEQERDRRWREQRPTVGPVAPAAPAPAAPRSDRWRQREGSRDATPYTPHRSPVPPSMGSPVPAQTWQARAGQPPAAHSMPAPQPRPAPPIMHTRPAAVQTGPAATPPPPPPPQAQSAPAPAQQPAPAPGDTDERRSPRIRPH